MTKQYIVIGAGILGASAALHLALNKAQVTVIDRNDAGKATNVAAGIISPWLSQRRNKAWYFLAKKGAAYYPQLIEKLAELGEFDTGYAQVGALHIHSEEKRIEQILALADKRKAEAPEIGETRKLSVEEITKMFPYITEPMRAAYASGGARVDGRKVTQSMKNAAIKLDAKYIEGDAALQVEDGKVIGVMVDGIVIEADEIIVTTGAWGNETLQPLKLDMQVKPQKAQILELQLESEKTEHLPVVMAPSTLYMLAFEEGRLMVGTTHEDDKGFDMRPTIGAAHEMAEKAFQIAPDLREAQLSELKVGFRPVVPNAIPVIGRLPQFSNVLVANGLGSSGLTVGPYLGKELAALAQGLATEIDVDNYQLTNVIRHEK
ncbi:FAD-dependent oxidoreductase [Metasolibacillus sp.]|uniref:NAD(P)/FAD-dependent oxidoreductase n=1 Tax=Metasolibacillus sp. TaxID=2703680 RepID=UPI0025EA852C|nr:FAD-dependent oxidoreductase [Metasolibacillus sp.]MCT6922690.1 FAD-binding oxidoreductase [Metasolibacillus sp.]MCT6938971.1 FAD-binding oxidoreductase [Metasolibacillus sp.]